MNKGGLWFIFIPFGFIFWLFSSNIPGCADYENDKQLLQLQLNLGGYATPAQIKKYGLVVDEFWYERNFGPYDNTAESQYKYARYCESISQRRVPKTVELYDYEVKRINTLYTVLLYKYEKYLQRQYGVNSVENNSIKILTDDSYNHLPRTVCFVLENLEQTDMLQARLLLHSQPELANKSTTDWVKTLSDPKTLKGYLNDMGMGLDVDKVKTAFDILEPVFTTDMARLEAIYACNITKHQQTAWYRKLSSSTNVRDSIDRAILEAHEAELTNNIEQVSSELLTWFRSACLNSGLTFGKQPPEVQQRIRDLASGDLFIEELHKRELSKYLDQPTLDGLRAKFVKEVKQLSEGNTGYVIN